MLIIREYLDDTGPFRQWLVVLGDVPEGDAAWLEEVRTGTRGWRKIFRTRRSRGSF
jgi:hypothetical protein